MIKPLSKKLTNFEKMFLDLNERCQLAFEVSKPDLIPKIINNVKNHLLGFHYKLEGSNIIYHNNPINVYSIPQTIKTARDACNFIDSIKYDVKDIFSAIAANDKMVAISAHHMLCDGGLLLEAFDNLLVNEPCQLKSKIPLTVCDMFPNELSNVSDDDIKKVNYSMDNVTKLQWSKNYEELRKIPGIELKCNHIDEETPAKEFQFQRSKINLTDLYMSSYLISILSLNGQIDSYYGLTIPFNMRKFLPKGEINFSNTQNTTELIINAFNVSPKLTVRQLSNILRQDLATKMNDKSPFSAYRCFLDDSLVFNHKFCCYPELSNLGQFKSDRFNYSELITDLWIQTTSTHPSDECIFMLTFSKMKNGERVFCSRLRQPCSSINDIDAKLLMKSFLRMMKDVPVDVSIQDAFDDLRKFQNKIKKEL